MRRLDSITISDDGKAKTISFWLGNPADITNEDPVDLMIVSAFQNNYAPTRTSIIGALDRRGVSVAALANDKAIDLRETAGFWMSRPILRETTAVGTRRILCFEPHFLGSRPAEVVGTLFRGLFPFLPDGNATKVAMAVIATGALGENPERMLRALVQAAAAWMSRGLPIADLRIMEQNPARSATLADIFRQLKGTLPGLATATRDDYELFLSFAKADAASVDVVRDAVMESMSQMHIFDYRHSVDPGKVWQDAIDHAIQGSRKMVAFLSPSYFASVECKEELNMARLRHKRENQSFLFPLYVRSLENEAELPLWLQAVTYVDCREADKEKLVRAATKLVRT